MFHSRSSSYKVFQYKMMLMMAPDSQIISKMDKVELQEMEPNRLAVQVKKNTTNILKAKCLAVL